MNGDQVERTALVATRSEAWLAILGAGLFGLFQAGILVGFVIGVTTPKHSTGWLSTWLLFIVPLFVLATCFHAALVEKRHLRAPDRWPEAWRRWFLPKGRVAAGQERKRQAFVRSSAEGVRFLRRHRRGFGGPESMQ
jgi:hypothetical protein